MGHGGADDGDGNSCGNGFILFIYLFTSEISCVPLYSFCPSRGGIKHEAAAAEC